jgi:hypothetical protein
MREEREQKGTIGNNHLSRESQLNMARRYVASDRMTFLLMWAENIY